MKICTNCNKEFESTGILGSMSMICKECRIKEIDNVLVKLSDGMVAQIYVELKTHELRLERQSKEKSEKEKKELSHE